MIAFMRLASIEVPSYFLGKFHDLDSPVLFKLASGTIRANDHRIDSGLLTLLAVSAQPRGVADNRGLAVVTSAAPDW